MSIPVRAASLLRSSMKESGWRITPARVGGTVLVYVITLEELCKAACSCG